MQQWIYYPKYACNKVVVDRHPEKKNNFAAGSEHIL